MHLGWVDGPRAKEMRAGISRLVTTRGVVARRPRPLVALVLGLVVAGQPQPIAALVLGLAVAGRPRPLAALVLGLAVALQLRVGVLTGATLVLGVAVAADSMSCPLFACPSAARPQPSPTTLFRTRWTWLCAQLPIGSISNSAKWLSI